MAYTILLLDNVGIGQSEGQEEENQEISEIQLPNLWTQYKKTTKERGLLSKEKFSWTKPPSKSLEKLTAYKNKEHKRIKIKFHTKLL